ncbi:MAG: FtsX-like permease family protein [Planctomycetota bacterium]
MFLRIVASQARYKWPITLLLWVAMTALVSLYVYLGNSARFSNRSMQLIMKRMGHNLLILPADADPLDTYLCSDGQTLFPDAVTAEMAQHTELASKYYVSLFQTRLDIGGRTLLLSGIRPVARPDETPEKGNLVTAIAPGHARLGSAAARALDAEVGDTVSLLSREFQVAEVLPPQGAVDDFRVFIPLAECQALLGEPGRINAIVAFLCMHGGTLPRVMARHRATMGELFPGFQVIPRMDIARGRDLARRTTSGYLRYLLAIVLCITVVVIVVTGLQEVSERRREVGILLAMGAHYVYVVGLYVAKLLAVALAAAVAGFFIGSYLSLWLMTPMLVSHTRPVALVWGHLPQVLWLTCLVAAAAAVVPMAKLVRMDPNAILIEE